MFSDSKKFIDTYYHLILEQQNLNDPNIQSEAKKKMIVKTVGAPIEDPVEPDVDGGFDGGADAGGAACCGEQNQQQLNEQDVSQKDAFLSKIYDLIDRAYAMGKQAAASGIDTPPMEDDEINDILASIEADFDGGRQIQNEQNQQDQENVDSSSQPEQSEQ